MSTNSAQLITQLKTLKLSGMADTLEVRLMEAENNSLSFSEFLSMVITDELQTRSNRKLQRLFGYGHADPTETLESFDFPFNPSRLTLLSIYDFFPHCPITPTTNLRYCEFSPP